MPPPRSSRRGSVVPSLLTAPGPAAASLRENLLLRALVFASLREAEIGPEVYPRVLDALVEGVVAVVPASIEEAAHG